MIDDYDRHSPGFLPELMRRSEQAQAHEERMDELAVRGQLAYLARGQWFGFAVAMTAVFGAIVCAALDQPAIGVALGLTGLAPVVGHFLKNNLFSENNPEPARPNPEQQKPALPKKKRP